jgi:hypothetical protein
MDAEGGIFSCQNLKGAVKRTNIENKRGNVR